jgi:Predicted secreted acid phosphatase
MKARLWQSLFLLNSLITTEIIFADNAKKDISDLKEQNIMSILYQQTAAERLAGSLQTFRSAKQAVDNALADSSWSALPGQDVKGKRPAIIVDVDETVLDNNDYEATNDS